MITQDQAQELWEAALAETYGIAVKTDHRRVLISELYRFRAKYGNDEIYALQISLPADEEWVWIHRKGLKQPRLRPMERSDLEGAIE